MLELNKSGTDRPGPGRLPAQGAGPDARPADGSPAPDAATAAERVPLRPYVIVAAILCGLYFLYSYLQYSRFGSPSWDLGIFEQEVRAYADLRAPVVDIKGPGYLILGDHFSPIVALLAPLYWLWPSAEALLFAQAAFFALGAVVVGRTTQQLLGGRSGLCVTVAYGLSWGIQEAVKADFHEIAFAVPLLALVCRALLLKRWTAALLWSLPLVLVKEDLGATVAVVGFLLFVYGRRLQGALLAAFGVAAFVVTLMVLIPAASSAGTYDYWQKIDKNGEQDVSMVDSLLGVLNSSVKIEMLVFLVGITAFMALRSPLTLLIVPTLGWRLLSQDSNHWGMVWHYSAILMPVLFLAMADGVRRSRGSHRPWLASYAKVVVPVSVAIAVAMTQHLPLRDLLRPDTYSTDARTDMARAALKAIPAGARVETDITLMAHLTSDRTVYWIGGAPGTAPDIVAINLDFGWSRPIQDPVAYAEQLHPEARYQLKHRGGSFVVMERTTPEPTGIPGVRGD
ncbi:DUF2079 domain-containing protein [Streptomyces microflavus]|uniref:DUF2079 domain-containing protein n=1 Tax=Streptomyces microflavus TaxID=1919 RepID=UPI00192AD5D0|nr:DUF2079 domain-containing protein [Streptomyces microflavus]QQZ56029.1 DUF2079 domain-containing protein [Streptomyces microflavus]